MKLLREIFNQPYEFSKGLTRGIHHRYSFKSERGDNFGVEFHHQHSEDNNKDEPHNHAEIDFDNGHTSNISNLEGTKSHKVFSTVSHVIKHHLEQHPNIKTISFTSTKTDFVNSPEKGWSNLDTGRTKLYSHMARHFTGVKKNEPNKHVERRNKLDTEFYIKTKDIK